MSKRAFVLTVVNPEDREILTDVESTVEVEADQELEFHLVEKGCSGAPTKRPR